MIESKPNQDKRHLLTVLLEDYFHVGAFNKFIQHGQWYRFETRFEQNTRQTLDLLDRHNVKATFFVLGWIADRQPEVVREVASRGHEIASRGYYHRDVQQLSPSEFREDLIRAREVLERASGRRVVGYRAPKRWTSASDLWALDILAEEGFDYDSSMVPPRRLAKPEEWLRFAYEHRTSNRSIWEFPISTAHLGPWLVPIAGGNYMRQFPHNLVRRAVRRWHETVDSPFVMYFHIWELDAIQPRISSASRLAHIRQYRNLAKMPAIIEEYLQTYNFVGMADYLGIDTTKPENEVESIELLKPREPLRLIASDSNKLARKNQAAPVSSLGRIPVTVVVPCFNEELILPYLANTLKSVEDSMSADYDLRFTFVDDCSTDGTWKSLNTLFSGKRNCNFFRQEQNQGVAAAIMKGISTAHTEIVCSLDCDCTYDPHELQHMIPMLTDRVAMVTASPYHPNGEVKNVPRWRLALSKASSFLYRQVLRQKLATYTSCFRVYRRSAMRNLKLDKGGFLGVAEMLGRLDLHGETVLEYPATLEVRLFGQSKMKVLKTIIGHLGLLSKLLLLRIRSRAAASGRPEFDHRAEAALETEFRTLSPTNKRNRS